jgi:PST family polysaccharide transporter
MKFATIVQLLFRILTIPFIFIFIKTSSDVWIYASIISFSALLSGVTCLFILWKKEAVFPQIISIKETKKYFRDALPFFWSLSVAAFKEESVKLFVGIISTMGNVAVYDLANKIVSILHTLTQNINSALFPKVIAENSNRFIKKIIRYETIIGSACIVFLIVFGYPIILLLGGKNMQDAYPVMLLFSVNILTWLIVEVYNSFVFVAKKRYYFVTSNQIMSLIVYSLLVVIGTLFERSIYIPILALVISIITEIFYCNYLIKKHCLL